MSLRNHGSPSAGARRSTLPWTTAVVLVAVAVAAAMSLPWIVAAICLSVLVLDRTRARRPPVACDLDRCLERCRRRGEETTFVVIDIPSTTAMPNLLQSLRITDSLIVRASASGCEVHGLLDGRNTGRTEVEKRFADTLNPITPAFGWASYPADGLTIDALYRNARLAIAAPPPQGESARPARSGLSAGDAAIELALEASPKVA